MGLETLSITDFRNIAKAQLTLSPSFNVIYGENGSGKTSLLEAIHYLSLGRSFRTHLHHRVIADEHEAFTLFASLQDETALGIEKRRSGGGRIRVNGDNCLSAAVLASFLPIQVINPDTHILLEGGPRGRRQFLDWGVFHVEPLFMATWQRAQLVLKQRNAALRQRLPSAQVTIWDQELHLLSEQLDRWRSDYMVAFLPVLQTLFNELWSFDVELAYYRGWNRDASLAAVLRTSLERDQQRGYTQFGPHRADIKITLDKTPAIDVFSRGQQKVFVICLRLAQGMLLKQCAEKQCLFLIDDMAAELDLKRREQLLELLMTLEAQVFVTTVDSDVLAGDSVKQDKKVFHVEHGVISELV